MYRSWWSLNVSTSRVIQCGGEGRRGFILSFPCLRSFFQLPSFGSPPRVVGVSAQLSSPSHCPREKPHTHSRHEAQNVVGGGAPLWCVSEHLSLGFRGVSGCVRVFSAALTHALSKHCEACLCISHDQFFNPSLTHNEKNLINGTPFKLNRSKSHFNGIGLV